MIRKAECWPWYLSKKGGVLGAGKDAFTVQNGTTLMPRGPLVSVVVATYNQQQLVLAQCLESISCQNYEPIEVIVVDNGASRDVRSVVKTCVPDARMIRLPKNVGFAGGYNAGIRAAVGRYVAILNDDAVACSNWLNAMLTIVENDKSIGVVGSIILDCNRPGLLDSCGVGVAFDGMSRQAMRGRIPPVLKGPKEVLLVSGCACLFRTQALQEVGLFDEDFFAYCEDTDLGLRLQWAGWKAVIAPECSVNHNYSMTTGRLSLQKLYWVERKPSVGCTQELSACGSSSRPPGNLVAIFCTIFYGSIRPGRISGIQGRRGHTENYF